MTIRTRSDSRALERGLVLVACGLWLIAQVLPAFTDPWHTQPDRSEYGWYETVFGWLAPLYLGPTGVPLLVGWTANLWFWAAVIGGAVNRTLRRPLALAAVVCGVIGLLTVISAAHGTQVGIGSWLWLGAMVLVAASTIAGRGTHVG